MNDTKAVIGMPLLSAVPSGASDTANVAYGIVIAIGLGLFAVYKGASRLSRDKVGFHEDRAREDVIKSLHDAIELERANTAMERAEKEKAMEEAREAWNTRTADAAKIAELTVTVKFLNETVDKLRREIHDMRDRLAPAAMKAAADEAKQQ